MGNDGISDIVVYTNYSVINGVAGPSDIWYRRLYGWGQPYGPEIQVTNTPANEFLNDISGDYIVFTAVEGPGALGKILLYKISSGELSTIWSYPDSLSPHVHGNLVTWRQLVPEGSQVMLYNMTSQKTICLAAGVIKELEIGDRFVVWSNMSGGQRDVVAYDLERDALVPVSSDPAFDEMCPSTSGPWIVFEVSEHIASPTGIAIYARNMDTDEWRLIVANGAWNERPIIDGDLISYESNVFGNKDILVHKLSTGETFQVTANPADQFLNHVSDNLVAYVDNRNGNYDIYVSKLTFIPIIEDNTPPSTTISLSGTLGSNDWCTSDVTVTFTATDDLSGVAIIYYSLDSATWLTYASPFTITTEGINTVQYYSVDNAGNQEATKTETIKIDKTQPNIIINEPLTGDYYNFELLTLDFTATDAVSGIDTVTATLDGTPVAYGQTIDLSTLSLGTHTLTVTATDMAGLTVPQQVTFNIINTPVGEDVVFTDPVTGIQITYDVVTSGGDTTITTSSTGSPPPTGLRIVGISGQPTYYDITTTVSYSGTIIVAVPYDETQIRDETKLKLWQFNTGWHDITWYVDTTNNIIYGNTTHLCHFIITYPIEYYLTVISPCDTPGGEGWYNEGDTVYAILATGLAYDNGLAYGFVGWSGDATGFDLISDPIVMDAPKTATAIWQASQAYGDVRTIGFWKHQVNVWYFTELVKTGMKIRGIGTAQVSEDVLIAYLTFIDQNSDYFQQKILGATNLDTLRNAYNILKTPTGTNSMKMRAEQQLLAVWLNLAYNAFFWNTQLSQDALYMYYQYTYDDISGLATIGEAILYCETELVKPDGNYEAAKDICDSMNNNLGIIWGT